MQNHESQEASLIQEVERAKNKGGRSRPRRLPPESPGSHWERTGRTLDISADNLGWVQ